MDDRAGPTPRSQTSSVESQPVLRAYRRRPLEDLRFAPVDVSVLRTLPASYFTSDTSDDVVAAEMAEPAVQEILRSAGLL